MGMQWGHGSVMPAGGALVGALKIQKGASLFIRYREVQRGKHWGTWGSQRSQTCKCKHAMVLGGQARI